MGIIKLKLYTVKQLTEMLQVSDETIYRLIRKGELEAYRIGGSWRISDEVVQRYLERGNKKE